VDLVESDGSELACAPVAGVEDSVEVGEVFHDVGSPLA